MDRGQYTQNVKRFYARYHDTAPGFNARISDLEFDRDEGGVASFTISIYFSLAAHSHLPLLINALASEGFPVREYMENFQRWLPVNHDSWPTSVTLHCPYDQKTKSGLTLPPGSGITLLKLVKYYQGEETSVEHPSLTTEAEESALSMASLFSVGLGVKNKVFPLADLDPLTEREIEVVIAVADGYSNIDISRSLNISTKTVERHKTHIYKKLGLSSGIDLVKYAIKKGLISL